MNELNVTGPLLLYDGVCGFCNKSVQLILKHDKQKAMRFAALQSQLAMKILAQYPELSGVDSVVLVEPGPGLHRQRVHIRSDAALRIASYLGGVWRLALAAYIIPRPIRDRLYDMFARRRYRIFGKYDSCMLPAPDERSRFLDVG